MSATCGRSRSNWPSLSSTKSARARFSSSDNCQRSRWRSSLWSHPRLAFSRRSRWVSLASMNTIESHSRSRVLSNKSGESRTMALSAELSSTVSIIAACRRTIKGCRSSSSRCFSAGSENTILAILERSGKPSSPITPGPHHERNVATTSGDFMTAWLCRSESMTRQPWRANSWATCVLPAPMPPHNPIIGRLRGTPEFSMARGGSSPDNPPCQDAGRPTAIHAQNPRSGMLWQNRPSLSTTYPSSTFISWRRARRRCAPLPANQEDLWLGLCAF